MSAPSAEKVIADLKQNAGVIKQHGKRAQLPDLAVEINRDLDETVGNVEIVPQEIGRVLLNLLGNAF